VPTILTQTENRALREHVVLLREMWHNDGDTTQDSDNGLFVVGF
jgi:hypothetical protein